MNQKKRKNVMEWDLKQYFYTSEHDPQIEKDVQATERAYLSFARKYRTLDFAKDATSLYSALVAYETLMSLPYARKALRYFDFRNAKNAKDSVAEKKLNLLEHRLTKLSNEILFFELALGNIEKQKQKKYCTDPKLKHFSYYLSRIFLSAKHMLTEPEERILSLKSGPSSSMWVAGTEKIISNREITYNNESMALPEAIERIQSVPNDQKQHLWNLALTQFENIAEVAENEFNAIITNKKISDELRHYKKPYSSTILGYENDEKSIEALVAAVSKKGFELSKKFYAIKAKLQGVTSIPYANKYDSIGTSTSLSFSDAVDICRSAFYGVKEEYGLFFDEMLDGGRIDMYPKKGKRGGAFMASDIGMEPFVFLNHTPDINSLYTLAHEMGHALHTRMSKKQSALYENYSITTAETASTLFETIVAHSLIDNAKETDKKILLHDRIARDIASIQRQIAFFNYELELHTLIRTQGAATKEELAHMMTKHLKSYLGSRVQVTEKDGYSFVYISHFRYGFYVYTYAYGQLMSNLLIKKLIADPKFVDKIDLFLSQGGSNTVENIFGSIGINTRNMRSFEEGLSLLETDIKKLEKMV
jgi:oligoendopeptidase F